ncbi:hypothetical protein A7X81_03610 [Campylobacter ornithocola]|uniref:Uncharacterized protein n=1 Tax=Campylobacter ornithocola TaxID=1848766 RepID=A0A6M8MUZ2_9BACT|nr:hypothetical protein [Campylobacter ornithocola]OCX42289.1 hypothetical protein A7X81_03610 [Campylobacter ornithocola]QKF57186.1 hypothetical protein CORN_0656 [Campylobacter ornithocola]
MAYYNPQQVVFNPSLGVIQNAGKVGGVLYDSMKQYKEEENKRRLLAQQDEELKARQEQNEINNAFLNNNLLQKERAFEYAMEQDRIKNSLALQDLLFKKEKIDLEQAKEQKQNQLLAKQAMFNLPSYTKSNPEMKAIEERFNTIKKGGGDSYYDGQGLLGGTWQNIKELFGANNINNEQDNLFKFMSDSIYNEKVRRDTTYNRTRHDEIYKEPSAWKPQTINAKEFERITRDYIAVNEAKINAYYDEQMAKISNLKNPYINYLYEEQRQKDLKDFKEGLAKKLSDYYIKNETTNNPGKIVDISQEHSNQPIITPLVDGAYLVEKDGKFYEASYAELKQMGVFE